MRRNKRFKLWIPGVFAVLALILAAGPSLTGADDRVAAIFGQGGSIFDETNEDAFETERGGSTEGGSLFGEGSIFDEIRENALSGDADEQTEDEDSIFKHVDESALNGASGKTGEAGETDNTAGPWFSSGGDKAAEEGDTASPEEVLLPDPQTGTDDGDGASIKKGDGDESSGKKDDEVGTSEKKADEDSASVRKADGESSETEKTESAEKAETGVSLEIPVQVKLSGAEEGKEARFSIRLLAGKSESAKGATINTPMPDSTVLTVESGKEAAFGPISFARTGIYRYAVAEDVPSGAVYNGSGKYEKEGIEYDTARYEVEVRVGKGDGKKLTAELYLEDEPAGTLIFENAVTQEKAGAESGTADADGGKTAESGTEISGAESIAEAAAGHSSPRDGSIRVYLAFLIIGSIALIILLILMRMR